MRSTDVSSKFTVPWASGAVAANVTLVPLVSTTPGRASLTTGFPPENFLPVGAGGIPPFGQDENGILQQITSWTRFLTTGGRLPFDQTFAQAIGGYPLGARVMVGANPLQQWINTIDNNTANPDTGGAGWSLDISSSYVAVQQGGPEQQQNNKVYVGWNGTGVDVQVDQTDLGTIVFEAEAAVIRAIGTREVSFPAGVTEWTCPPNVFGVWVEGMGAGGSGAGTINLQYPGGGGGGGGYGRKYIPTVPGTVYQITVGVGAAASAGGTSSFGTLLVCSGGLTGTPGTNSNIGTTGAGGAVSGADFAIPGSGGSNGIVYASGGAVEGGSGGSSALAGPVRAVGGATIGFNANPGNYPGGGSSGCTNSTAKGGDGFMVLRY